MSCYNADTKWCGNSTCRDTNTSTGSGPKGKAISCPIGYKDDGWKVFKNGIKSDTFLRVCKRIFTDDPITKLNCATNSNGSAPCPNDVCNAMQSGAINYMNTHCNLGENAFGDEHCIKWKLANLSEYNKFMNRKCNDVKNLGKEACRNYCLNNPGKCDSTAEFCKKNTTDSLCSCINSSLNNLPGSASAPAACFDNACQTTGYKTKAMHDISKNCPSYTEINCNQILTSTDSSAIQNSNLKQICNAQTALGGGTEAAAPSIESDGMSWTSVLLVFIFFVFLLFIVYKFKTRTSVSNT